MKCAIILVLIFTFICGNWAEDLFALRTYRNGNNCVFGSGSSVNLWPCDVTSPNYQWAAEPFTGGYFRLKSKSNNQCLTASGSANRSPILLSACSDSVGQQWQYLPSGLSSNGVSAVYISNRLNNKCASVNDESFTNSPAKGYAIVQWDCIKKFNQEFYTTADVPVAQNTGGNIQYITDNGGANIQYLPGGGRQTVTVTRVTGGNGGANVQYLPAGSGQTVTVTGGNGQAVNGGANVQFLSGGSNIHYVPGGQTVTVSGQTSGSNVHFVNGGTTVQHVSGGSTTGNSHVTIIRS